MSKSARTGVDIKTASEPSAEAPPILRAEHVQIGYQMKDTLNIAVQDVTFDVFSGETMVLLGPSGCGKSTLLKAIAGFLHPLSGSINVAGRADLKPGPDRAVVFQEFDQLFPWRTVLDNVAYPLRRNGRSKSVAEASARKFLGMMGLSEALDKHPHHLSGGMKQRVSIARALALEPLMLLMDEPFGALDALTRARLQHELNTIADMTGVTILFVTHSIDEAIILGDRVIVLGEPPSVVRDVVRVTAAAKSQDTEDYLNVRTQLHGLLTPTEVETDEGFYE